MSSTRVPAPCARIVNRNTRRADVEALPEIVARLGRAVDAELRPAGAMA